MILTGNLIIKGDKIMRTMEDVCKRDNIKSQIRTLVNAALRLEKENKHHLAGIALKQALDLEEKLKNF